MKKLVNIALIFLLCTFVHARKIGLALSGGGAKGLAHIGVLKVFDEKNIKIDYIAGTSTGAFIGALYSMGYSALEIEQIVLDLKWENIFLESVSRSDLYIAEKRWMPYANVSFQLDEENHIKLPKAFLTGNNLINFLFRVTYDASKIRNFDELPIPFRCVSTNILNGEKKIFEKGAIHESVLASMAYPSLIYPVQIDNEIYIDGGISTNLPAKVVKNMGADHVIGLKTTTGLKTEKELNTIVNVLEQTVNIRMNEKIQQSLQYCDELIEPDVSSYDIMDFDKKAEIIALGEEAARDFFANTTSSFLPRNGKIKRVSFPDKIQIDKIEIKGNLYLSTAKIKEYLEIEAGEEYSKKEIIKKIKRVYNSELFSLIYPIIETNEDITKLVVKVTEKKRKKLDFGISYNSESEISAGAILDLRNLVQPNSRLKLNLQLGDNTNLNLDYVKNFGKHFGVYFRIFPYLKEEKLYHYNSDHEKTRSVRALETGGTFGVGIFASDAIILEGYGYGFKKNLYKDIAEFTDTEYHSAGIGLKLYHESLDDFYFPMRGARFLAKYSTARKGVFSEEGNKKFFSKMKFFLPVQKFASLKYKFEYGSYFEDADISYDPFYIGGLDSFLGLNSREFSAPIYKIHTLALRITPLDNFFIDLQSNFLNLGNVDYWIPEKDIYRGYGIKLGYKTLFGPIRIGAALDEEAREYFYISLGFEQDPFIFSRR